MEVHQDLPKLMPVAETIKRDIESGKHDDLLAKNFKVAFMSEKGQGLQPYQMQGKWAQIQLTGEIKKNPNLIIWRLWTKYFSFQM